MLRTLCKEYEDFILTLEAEEENGFYGLNINLYKAGRLEESCQTGAITGSRCEAEKILAFMADNFVCPNHVLCVLSDVFGK